MAGSTNKKRTAVVAAAAATALVLTGTVAWNMAQDQTVLNELPKENTGEYNVLLDEDFDPANPWANKDVWAENTGDNTVIVRMRLEEFYDITYRNGNTYNNKEGYSTDNTTANAIFNVPGASTLTGNDADSSTELDNSITLHFGPNVMTIDAWQQAGSPYADADGKGYWVIDADGWCYYTKALAASEKTEWLLDDVDLDKDILTQTYKPPYELSYKINVRLQAMSADLADFGSETDNAQWTYLGTSSDGRYITADQRTDDFEILNDQTISDSAKALVMGIENPDKAQGKAATNVTDLKTLLADEKTDVVSLSNDITITNAEEMISVPNGAKTVNLNGHTLKTDGSTIPLNVGKDATLTVEGGTIDGGSTVAAFVSGTMKLNDVNVNSENNYAVWVENNGSLELNGANVTSAKTHGLVVNAESDITISGSTITAETAGVDAICINGENINVNIEDSTVSGGTNAIRLIKGATLNAKNTTFKSNLYGIGGNNTVPANEVNLTGCTVEAGLIGVFKPDDTPLTMTNCNVKVNATDTGAVGICVRSGDVTLNNVNVAVDCGANTITKLHDDDSITNYYATKSGFDEFGYNALQVVLNSYEDINLTIDGGSYTTNVDGAKSVFVCNGKTIHSGKTYANTITVTGTPTFAPSFTFGSYDNTTVN
ncbi:right-handed parallel beta-helix repeat-containing protein [Ruminococcus sp. zg-921]|uniref:right-handed parallel beta-helix repeat-containing protein n=1 Tax=Ruminococcus sp. zg-921 TaxID=2678506 RepID=UPI00210EC001|nr:right-handed parallel beta-helix repeat-containing protein [Ruminococcus sp. zg-921]MCQ4115174.1 hypothetical protein [Ruminococcus sp. zg-921]